MAATIRSQDYEPIPSMAGRRPALASAAAGPLPPRVSVDMDPGLMEDLLTRITQSLAASSETTGRAWLRFLRHFR